MDTVHIKNDVNLHMDYMNSKRTLKPTANIKLKSAEDFYKKDSALMETAAISYIRIAALLHQTIELLTVIY